MLKRIDRQTFTQWAPFLAAGISYVVVRFWFVADIDEEKTSPDTQVYLQMAAESVFSGSFWGGLRPPTVPFIYKLVGAELPLIGILQWCVSVACWLLLASAVANHMVSRVGRFVSFALILAFSFSSEIMLWDFVVLSESISISLMALFVAAWLGLFQDWTVQRLILVGCIGVVWGFARESNAWVLLMVSGALMVAAVLKYQRRDCVWLGGTFLCFFVLNNVSSNAGPRWEFPLLNNIGQRILTDADATEFFVTHGMPDSPALREMEGKWASSDDWRYYKDPELLSFRTWLRQHGKRTYMWYLLSRPAETISAPFRHPEFLFTPALVSYAPAGFAPVLRGVLAELIYVRAGTRLMLWLSFPLLAAGTYFAIRRGKGAWTVPLALILIAFPHAALIWNADAMESGRHSIQAGIHLRLGLWILLLFAANPLFILATPTDVREHFAGPEDNADNNPTSEPSSRNSV